MRKERVGEREEEEEQSQKAEDDEGRGSTNRRSIKNWKAAGGRGTFTYL